MDKEMVLKFLNDLLIKAHIDNDKEADEDSGNFYYYYQIEALNIAINLVEEHYNKNEN